MNWLCIYSYKAIHSNGKEYVFARNIPNNYLICYEIDVFAVILYAETRKTVVAGSEYS